MVKNKEEAPYGYIYKITHTINGKVYIGKTGKTIEERWSRHLGDARGKNQGFKSRAQSAAAKNKK